MNYERLVQWVAGPVSALVGIVATKIVHGGISHNAALNITAFGLSAAATYFAHAKWTSNLVHWWEHNKTPLPGDPTIGAGGGFVWGDPTATTPNRLQVAEDEVQATRDAAEQLRAQLRASGREPVA